MIKLKMRKKRCKILVEFVFEKLESYLKYIIPDSISLTKTKMWVFSRRFRICYSNEEWSEESWKSKWKRKLEKDCQKLIILEDIKSIVSTFIERTSENVKLIY